MRRHRMAATVAAATALLAGCGGETKGPPDLALACQTTACECAEAGGGLFTRAKTEPVRWRLNGDAYCREGYALRVKKNK